ncbi:MAG TPA: deoxyguanosinetriphosphate triphosphohydrolase family protein [Candidatus Brocadiia bacterium]|nr:HD domain-containing protein [Candidatus Brocadiales bacterium]
MHTSFDEESIYKNPITTLSINSKGRKKPLKQDGYRTEFQRDIHRIIYSQPFRRLRHKTQVFFLPKNDHICTRMEHVLHVASASRTVARHLQVNEDLVEAIGLGHDVGHAPFGHHGEKVLSDLSKRFNLNINFQHEVHGLRVVDKLAELDRETEAGLNLTYEVRDGIISHCGEEFSNELVPERNNKDLEKINDRKDALMPCTIEGCVVRMVDKIVYAGRDIEDALVAGLIKEDSIPKDIINGLGENNGKIIGTLLEDLVNYSKANPGKIVLSNEKHELLKKLIEFNYKEIYRSGAVDKYKKHATRALEELFTRLLDDLKKTDRLRKNPDSLPDAKVYDVLDKFIKKINYSEEEPNALIVLDFMAGMTDNYVVNTISDIFVPKGII